MGYEYIGEQGDFYLENPEMTSSLYFPLANETGIMGCVTPDLGGDSKIGQNAFLLPPQSSWDLHNDKSSRNFWCVGAEDGPQSLTGRSGRQQSVLFSGEKEPTYLEAGFMWHKIGRKLHGLDTEIINFSPSHGGRVELIKVSMRNTGKNEKRLRLISAIPIYGRSADNIRDHRHVTKLLHRIETVEYGVVVNPTMTFDERGHQKNSLVYGVFGGNGSVRPEMFFPTVEGFIGEGGNLENPRAVYEGWNGVKSGERINGQEALGALAFPEINLQPGETAIYYFVLSYGTDVAEMEKEARQYFCEETFENSLNETKAYWQNKVNVIYHTKDRGFNLWMRWVSFQPMLRRLYGCSFLPHHDYGKGGRGWRDLWQDCLALLLMDPDGVRQMLIDNFAGVRTDGTNATIIGQRQGEFVADRNGITRVWMDHGVWPFLTTQLYIHQTGDLNILLEENTYFKDMQICRGEKKDSSWDMRQGALQLTCKGEVYKGSILEHLLVQHLCAFYDVGEHNHIRLRGADWNDALDMAKERGESVAFTCMYAKNLECIADLLAVMQKAGVEKLTLMEELQVLLGQPEEIFVDVQKKQEVLEDYAQLCGHSLSGKKAEVDSEALQRILLQMAGWIYRHIRENEWIEECAGKSGWYNGYYDNSGNAVEGIGCGSTRMMLTSQVFAIMSGTATDRQVGLIANASDRHLYDANVGGYRLNTDFNEIKLDFGRMFGFAYGQKENGAVFSHMAVMYAYALYERHCYKPAYHAVKSLYRHCSDFSKSKIYPGVPEYIDADGRGAYHYLTGAASWLLLTVVTQMFGVRGEYGDLGFAPQLLAEQFDAYGEASLELVFAGRKLSVTYENKNRLESGEYKVNGIYVNGVCQNEPKIAREALLQLPKDQTIEIKVILG